MLYCSFHFENLERTLPRVYKVKSTVKDVVEVKFKVLLSIVIPSKVKNCYLRGAETDDFLNNSDWNQVSICLKCHSVTPGSSALIQHCQKST